MDLRDLYYFEAIADCGHMGRAAERVFRTQPALSKCIQRLEEQLSAALFERVGHRLVLTPVGDALLARARFLRRSLEDTVREVDDVARGVTGHVRIGHTATAAEQLLPKVISLLRREMPGVTMELGMGMNDELRTSLRAGDHDLLVGPLSPGDGEFTSHVMFSDHVVVACSRSHPLAGRPRVRMKDLAACGWVMPPRGVAIRDWLDRTFEGRGLPPPKVEIDSGSISLMPRLIADTELLTFISRENLGAGSVMTLLRELEFAPTTLRREIGVVMRANGYLSPAVRTAVGLLKARGRELRATA
jgi:DNA-binding transcriptional LysR family regulator